MNFKNCFFMFLKLGAYFQILPRAHQSVNAALHIASNTKWFEITVFNSKISTTNNFDVKGHWPLLFQNLFKIVL